MGVRYPIPQETDKRVRFTALAEYFRRWCESVDAHSDTGDARNVAPRFTSCLVIDGESLAALAQIEELPPLRCAATKRDMTKTMGAGYPAWLWLVEARYMALPAARREEGRYWREGDAYPGWL